MLGALAAGVVLAVLGASLPRGQRVALVASIAMFSLGALTLATAKMVAQWPLPDLQAFPPWDNIGWLRAAQLAFVVLGTAAVLTVAFTWEQWGPKPAT